MTRPVDPNGWQPTPQPSLADVDMWPDAEWHQAVDQLPVDHDRTRALHALDKPVRTTTKPIDPGGSDWRAPWHRTDDGDFELVDVYEASRPPEVTGYHTVRFLIWKWKVAILDHFPSTKVPLPKGELRRLGDPNATHTDCQAFIVDVNDRRYYELSSIAPSVWPVPPEHPWRAGTIAVWDLNAPWPQRNRSGNPLGITGARVPFLPELATYEDYETGMIRKAQHWAAAGYSPEHTGIARTSDGVLKGHPLRAGERLRLTTQARARLEDEAQTLHDQAWIAGAAVHGFIVTDYTDPKAGDLIRRPQDPRVQLTLDGLRRTDFEVLAQ